MESLFTEPFEVTNVVKQDCFMALTLLLMMLSAILSDNDTGFPIKYRFDGNLFNLRRFYVKTKVKTDVLYELPNADDKDKNASSDETCKGPWIKSDSHVIL